MRVIVKVQADDGRELGELVLNGAERDVRCWLHEHGTKPIAIGDQLYLIGFDFRPFTERQDRRPQATIEQANSDGGSGKRRAEMSGGKIKHRAVTPKS